MFLPLDKENPIRSRKPYTHISYNTYTYMFKANYGIARQIFFFVSFNVLQKVGVNVQ